MYRFIVISILLLITLSFPSCSDDDPEDFTDDCNIIGTYEILDSSAPNQILEFRNDRSFWSFGINRGDWSIVDACTRVEIDQPLTGDFEFNIEIASDTLTVTNSLLLSGVYLKVP